MGDRLGIPGVVDISFCFCHLFSFELFVFEHFIPVTQIIFQIYCKNHLLFNFYLRSPIYCVVATSLIGSYIRLNKRSGKSFTSVRNSVFYRVERSGTRAKDVEFLTRVKDIPIFHFVPNIRTCFFRTTRFTFACDYKATVKSPFLQLWRQTIEDVYLRNVLWRRTNRSVRLDI